MFALRRLGRRRCRRGARLQRGPCGPTVTPGISPASTHIGVPKMLKKKNCWLSPWGCCGDSELAVFHCCLDSPRERFPRSRVPGSGAQGRSPVGRQTLVKLGREYHLGPPAVASEDAPNRPVTAPHSPLCTVMRTLALSADTLRCRAMYDLRGARARDTRMRGRGRDRERRMVG